MCPYSYLKFYAIFSLAKFTTNTLKTKQSDYFTETQNVLNYQCVKLCCLIVAIATMLTCSEHFY